MLWEVKVEQWMEGKPLYIRNIEAESKEAAEKHIQKWYREFAGVDFDLPCEASIAPLVGR